MWKTITLYIDADACPVKDEAVRVAERHGLTIHFVANSWMRLPEGPLIKRVVVAEGPDAADDWIAQRAGAGDIVVTADIPLAARCLKAGARVRAAERDPRKAWFLQPLGGVGQVSAVRADLTRPATIDVAVEGADAVINLVGTFKGNLDAVHVEGAKRAAAAARAVGATAFVHISALGADPGSASDYGRTKGLGEQAIDGTRGETADEIPHRVRGHQNLPC